MTVFLLSLLGFPGTAGFMGKWYILSAAIEADQRLLAVILVATSVISAGFYLPPIMAMYMRPAPSAAAHQNVRLAGAARWAVAVMAAGTLLFGFWPNRMLEAARQGGASLRPPAAYTSREIP
jgi:NADH-quinone oxidoreductase subunit N